MGINIDYAKIAEALVKNIQQGDRSEGQLAPEEKEYLHSMGVKGLTDQVYMGALNKIGANTQTERKVVIEELKKFTDRIGELVPNYQEFSEIILELFQNAMNVKTVEELFKLFGDKISELEKADKNKSTEDKDLERLIFKNTSYAEQMNNNDYSRLIEILTSNPAKYNPEIKNNENSTIFKFKYNNKSYEITINKRYDVEAIEKTIIKNTPKSTEEFENIIKSFARGELHWSDFAEQLELFGFSEAELSNASKYNYLNDGYEITLNFNGKKYTFNCNIKGANDSVSSNNPGETYTLLEPNEVKNQGFTEEQLATYFVKAVVIDGKVEYYTKNKAAWETLGLSSKDSIATLKNTIKKAEDLQHITDVVNEVINDMTNKYTLTSYEVDQLRGYLQNGAQKNKIEGLLGKDDDQIKSSVTSIAETFVTENIRKSGTKGADAASTSSLTDGQKSTIKTICIEVATAVGISSTTLEERVTADAVEFAGATDFETKVQQKAFEIAQAILKESKVSSSEEDDLNTLMDLFAGGNLSALSKLKEFYNNGKIEIVIQQDGSENDFWVSIYADRNKTSLLGSNGYTREQLIAAGFNIGSIINTNTDEVGFNSIDNNNISDSEKAENLLEICRGFMRTAVTNGGNSRVLTFDETMDVFNKVKSDISYTKTYSNVDTFKNAVTKKAEELAKEKVKNTPSQSTSSQNTQNETDVITFNSQEKGAFMASVSSTLWTSGCRISGVEGEGTTKVKIHVSTNSGDNAGTLEVTKHGITYNREGATATIPQEALNRIMQLSPSKLTAQY